MTTYKPTAAKFVKDALEQRSKGFFGFWAKEALDEIVFLEKTLSRWADRLDENSKNNLKLQEENCKLKDRVEIERCRGDILAASYSETYLENEELRKQLDIAIEDGAILVAAYKKAMKKGKK